MKSSSKLIEEIFNLSRLLKENMSFNSSACHLTMVQIQCLIFIKHQKKVPMRDIAAKFNIELPSATSLIDNLARENLVLRSNDPDDRRAVLINLSSKGKKLILDAIREREKKFEKMLSFLTEKDKKDLLRIMKKMSGELNSEKN